MHSKVILASILLASASAAFAENSLTLSTADSAAFFDTTILPFVSTEIVVEDGKEYAVLTRQSITTDKFLNFTCKEKLYGGLRVNITCVANIDSTATLSQGNRFQTGIANSTRATVGWYKDLPGLSSIFKYSGVCRSDVQTSLFTSQEKRKVTLPNGRETVLPLLTVNCYGNSQYQLTQLITTIVPRDSN